MKKQPPTKKIKVNGKTAIYHTIPYIADKWKVSYNTVWLRIHRKQLKAIKLGAWYVKEEWMSEFLQTHPDQRG